MKIAQISWNANTEPDADEYQVYVRPRIEGAVGELKAEIKHPVTNCEITLQDGEYDIYIICKDWNGNPSEPSDPVSVVIDSIPPAKPTGLRVLIKN